MSGDRPKPDDERLSIPLNPCVPCWRVNRLLIPATHVAENRLRKITLCRRHFHEFREMDQDYRGGDQDKGLVQTSYREIRPGEHVRVDGGGLL